MSIATLDKLMTADEFYDFMQQPQNRDRYCELQRGEIIDVGVPKKPHGVVCSNIAFFLQLHARQVGGGYVCTNDSGFITERDPDTVRGVDVAYYDDATTYDEVAESSPKYTSSPPVIAVEVMSPDDRINRVLGKVGEYLAAGVQQVWVVDPESRDVTVNRRGHPIPVTLAGDAVLEGGETLPGFQLPLAEIFRLPTQSATQRD